MTIPASLSAQLAALQSAYTAAGPIDKAPPLVYADIDQKAYELILALDAQVATVGKQLDGFAPGTSPLLMAQALASAAQAANDELDAYEMRSLVGRFAANIELIEGWGKYFKPAQQINIAGSVISTLDFSNPARSGNLAALPGF